MYPCGTAPASETALTLRPCGVEYGENGFSPAEPISTRDASHRSTQNRWAMRAISGGHRRAALSSFGGDLGDGAQPTAVAQRSNGTKNDWETFRETFTDAE